MKINELTMMMKIPMIRTLFAGLVLAAVAVRPLPAEERATDIERPNIVVIFMDDMGYADLASYGAVGYPTPHMDRMAAEGMRFTNFLAPQPVCTAARAGLMTGAYPNRVRLGGALPPTSKRGIDPDESTMAELLKAGGYATGIFGKWHLGHLPKYLPLQHGFDEFFGLPYSNDMWAFDWTGKPAVPGTARFQRNYPPLPLMEGNEQIEVIDTMEQQGELTRRYTERAVSFIKRNQDKPFFLYVPHSMPHVPIAASDRFKGKSGTGVYGDVMMELDWSVGEIIRSIDESGLGSKTLVIVTSDNGPWRCFGNWAGSTGGLREGKRTVFEGGQRVSCLMRWPGRIPAGTVNNKLASTIDILPTAVALSGAPRPTKIIDGVDITPLLNGDSGPSPRRHFYYYFNGNSLNAVRRDDWKLMFAHSSTSFEAGIPGKDGVRGTEYQVEHPMALYDLSQDPGERSDVQTLYPEIMAELQQVAEIARADLGDDLTDRPGPGRRPR